MNCNFVKMVQKFKMKKVDKTVVQILNSVTVKKVNLNIFIGLVINLIVVNRKSICSLERLDTWPK